MQILQTLIRCRVLQRLIRIYIANVPFMGARHKWIKLRIYIYHENYGLILGIYFLFLLLSALLYYWI